MGREIFFNTSENKAEEMAQRVKVHATKYGDLSSILRTNRVERNNQLSCRLASDLDTQICVGMCAQICKLIHADKHMQNKHA